MRVKIEKTTRELKQDRNGNDCTGVMFGGEWYNMPGDQRKLFNKTVDVEVKGKWARLVQAQASGGAHANGNGAGPKIKLADYERVMRRFHSIASELEHDDAQARTALVDTALIAYSNGKIEIAPEDDETGAGTGAPFDDDIPF